METCATSPYWAREIAALGHEVRLMPPAYVKAYLQRQKNDAADAEAICEAVRRPTMRFVPAKGAEQQAVLMLHRRELLVRQRTMLVNALRAHLAEFAFVGFQGRIASASSSRSSPTRTSTRVPAIARPVLHILADEIAVLQQQIDTINRSGTDPTPSAGGWQRYGASDSLPRRQSSPACRSIGVRQRQRVRRLLGLVPKQSVPG